MSGAGANVGAFALAWAAPLRHLRLPGVNTSSARLPGTKGIRVAGGLPPMLSYSVMYAYADDLALLADRWQ